MVAAELRQLALENEPHVARRIRDGRGLALDRHGVILPVRLAETDRGIVGRNQPPVPHHEGSVLDRQSLGQIGVVPEQAVRPADREHDGHKLELQLLRKPLHPVHVAEVDLLHAAELAEPRELRVGQHHVRVAGCRRPPPDLFQLRHIRVDLQVDGIVKPQFTRYEVSRPHLIDPRHKK